jgi:hypothetical protein
MAGTTGVELCIQRVKADKGKARNNVWEEKGEEEEGMVVNDLRRSPELTKEALNIWLTFRLRV